MGSELRNDIPKRGREAALGRGVAELPLGYNRHTADPTGKYGSWAPLHNFSD